MTPPIPVSYLYGVKTITPEHAINERSGFVRGEIYGPSTTA
jgi:hypothetical protein